MRPGDRVHTVCAPYDREDQRIAPEGRTPHLDLRALYGCWGAGVPADEGTIYASRHEPAGLHAEPQRGPDLGPNAQDTRPPAAAHAGTAGREPPPFRAGSSQDVFLTGTAPPETGLSGASQSVGDVSVQADAFLGGFGG